MGSPGELKHPELVEPLLWEMQKQGGRGSRTGWISHVIHGPQRHFFCSRVNFAVKTCNLHLPLHREDFSLEGAFFIFFYMYFSGITYYRYPCWLYEEI